MKILLRRSLATLVLAVFPVMTSSCGGGEERTGIAAAAGPMCGPCDMTMPADFPLTEIAGLKFAVCGGRCEELISADPQKYAKFAVEE